MTRASTTAQTVDRRSFLARAGALGSAAFGPWIVSPLALASSGEINVLMWPGHLPEPFKTAFESKTGIKINHLRAGSNEQIIATMKATQGRGIDLCSPSNMRSPQWIGLELLAPFDLSRIRNLANVNPLLLDLGKEQWNFGGAAAHWLPQTWGAEAIAWRTDKYTPPADVPSYGDIWRPDVKGKTMLRPHSGILGAGLYLERSGRLEPGAMKRAYAGADVMRATWDVVTEFCIKHKAQIKLFWNDADGQMNGFLNDGVVLGQTWDDPPLAMKRAGKPVTYQAPQEGALVWVDGVSLSRAARDVDAVYEFLDFAFAPEHAALAVDGHGYNSAVLGAEKLASASYAKNFAEAYPGDAVHNLWPWPAEPAWYADLRMEYGNKLVSA